MGGWRCESGRDVGVVVEIRVFISQSSLMWEYFTW